MAFSTFLGDLVGQVFALIVLTVAAACTTQASPVQLSGSRLSGLAALVTADWRSAPRDPSRNEGGHGAVGSLPDCAPLSRHGNFANTALLIGITKVEDAHER